MNTSQIAHWFNKIEVVQEYWTVILTVNVKCARARIYTSSIKNNKASWTSKRDFESGEQNRCVQILSVQPVQSGLICNVACNMQCFTQYARGNECYCTLAPSSCSVWCSWSFEVFASYSHSRMAAITFKDAIKIGWVGFGSQCQKWCDKHSSKEQK